MQTDGETALGEGTPAVAMLRGMLGRGGTVLALLLLSVVLIAIGEYLSPGYASGGNLLQLAKLSSFMGIAAIGQTLVILVGGIDLSIAWVFTAAAFAFTTLTNGGEERIAVAGVAAVAVGVVSGLLNGIGIAKLRISPIIMTLAMNAVVQGLTLVWTNGAPLGVPASLRVIATGSVGAIPIMLILWVVLAAVIIGMLKLSRGGRLLLSVGENPRVSWLSGIGNGTVLIAAYTVSGVCSAVAGVLFTGYSNTTYLGMGDAFVLPSIAAVVLGGTSILGGRGGYGGTIAGAIFITVLSTDLVIQNIGPGVRNIIFGVVVIAAVISRKMLLERERDTG